MSLGQMRSLLASPTRENITEAVMVSTVDQPDVLIYRSNFFEKNPEFLDLARNAFTSTKAPLWASRMWATHYLINQSISQWSLTFGGYPVLTDLRWHMNEHEVQEVFLKDCYRYFDTFIDHSLFNEDRTFVIMQEESSDPFSYSPRLINIGDYYKHLARKIGSEGNPHGYNPLYPVTLSYAVRYEGSVEWVQEFLNILIRRPPTNFRNESEFVSRLSHERDRVRWAPPGDQIVSPDIFTWYSDLTRHIVLYDLQDTIKKVFFNMAKHMWLQDQVAQAKIA